MLSNELEELFGRNPQDRASQWDVDDPRPERGTMVPLYTRWMRFLQGDPCYYATASSTGPSNPVGIPGNVAGARSCVIYVAGGNIIYRTDGQIPTAAGDQTIQQGSTVTLTGKPSMLSFQFAGAVGAVTLYMTFYD
jgi:hypothetical protein